MALSIKTTEADRMARELVALTHESITEAVTNALRERLDRLRQPPQVDTVSRLDRLSLEYGRLVVHDSRSADEILGYDEAGLPG